MTCDFLNLGNILMTQNDEYIMKWNDIEFNSPPYLPDVCRRLWDPFHKTIFELRSQIVEIRITLKWKVMVGSPIGIKQKLFS